MKKVLSAILLLASSNMAFSYSECIMDVDSVYVTSDDGGAEVIWIELSKSDGSSTAVYKDLSSELSEDQKNRIYSMGLTAFTSGKRLKVRYPENGLNCDSLGAARKDFLGLRMVK
ncbi:hypothetical protein [Microbulbifer sp. DLAB2-AA]|uniref:hypothetical protein n=1 Tax=Microbulbifer sp. DLAB2-AA TaxID=3243394 RepID=UPI004039862B